MDPNSAWLVEGFMDGALDADQLAELKRLIRADPAVREAMTTELRLRGLARAARHPSQLEESVAAAIEDLSPQRHEEAVIRGIGEENLPRSVWRPRWSWAVSAAAAGLIAAVGLAVWLLRPAPALVAGWQVTPTGNAQYRVVRSDRVRLDRGELFVQSTPAASRPVLTIETPNGLATAKGTEFYIGAHADAETETSNRKEADMKKLTRVLILSGVVTLANAYGETAGKANELLVAEAGKAPVNQAVTAAGSFAADLYAQLAKENPGKNLFFSPYSMSSALAMTAEGARGETAAEMGKVLGFPDAAKRIGNDAQLLPWNTALIHTGMKALNDRFQTKPVPQALRDELDATRKELAASQAEEKKLLAGGRRTEKQWVEQWKKSEALKKKLNALSLQMTPYEIRVANALYGEKTYPFRTEYMDTINKFYNTGAFVPVDFKGNWEAARLQINGWVEQQTHERIKDLLKEGMLDDLTRLVLVNAICFNGDWAVPFEAGATKPEDFLAAGQKVSVPMMRKDKLEGGRYGAFKADGTLFATPQRVPAYRKPDPATVYPGKGGFQVAELPYKGGELSMAVIVPQDADGLAAVEQQLTSANLQAWLGQLAGRDMHVQMPKFKMETDYPEMKNTLQALGMKLAFDPFRANFDGMCASQSAGLYIKFVAHKAFVEVNEQGTEAAAATAVMVQAMSAPRDEPFTPTLRADRPFLFAIRDVQTGTILFVGRMVDPTGTAPQAAAK